MPSEPKIRARMDWRAALDCAHLHAMTVAAMLSMSQQQAVRGAVGQLIACGATWPQARPVLVHVVRPEAA